MPRVEQKECELCGEFRWALKDPYEHKCGVAPGELLRRIAALEQRVTELEDRHPEDCDCTMCHTG